MNNAVSEVDFNDKVDRDPGSTDVVGENLVGENGAQEKNSLYNVPVISFSESKQLNFSAVLLVNYLACKLWLSLSYFEQARPTLVITSSVIFTILSVVLLVLIEKERAVGVFNKVKAGIVDYDLLELCALSLLLVPLILNFYSQNWLELFEVNQSFLICGFLVGLERYFRVRFAKVLSELTDNSQSGDGVAGQLALNENEELEVEAGQEILADGVLISGIVEVNERQISGLSQRRLKNVGNLLYAGSEILEGKGLYRIERSPEDSLYTTCLPVLNRLQSEIVDAQESARHRMFPLVFALAFVTAFAGIVWVRSGVEISQLLSGLSGLLFATLTLRMVLLIASFKSIVLSNLFRKGILLPSLQAMLELSKKTGIALMAEAQQSWESVKLAKEIVLDDRIEATKLRALNYVLASYGERKIDRAWLEAVVNDEFESEIFELKNYLSYGPKGVSATVEGSEISYGTEEFLIERGVYVQASDLVSDQTVEAHYLAINDQVVACNVFKFSPIGQIVELKDSLSRDGYQVNVWSGDFSKEELSAVLDTAGFDHDLVRGGLSHKDLERGLDREGLAVFVSSDDYRFSNYPSVLKMFSRLHWEIDPKAIMIFSDTVAKVKEAFCELKRVMRVEKVLFGAGFLINVALICLAALRIIDPGVVLGVEVAYLVIIYFTGLKLVCRS